MSQSGVLATLLIDTLVLGRPLPEATARMWTQVADDNLEQLIATEGAGSWLHARLRSLRSGAGWPAHALANHVRATAMEETAAALRAASAATEALGVLQTAGIEVVLLKGAAYGAVARAYPLIDARSMIDVDLLVSPESADAAWQALARAGFEPTPPPEFPPPPGHHHLSGLWSAQRVSIELHTSTSRARTPADAWRRMRGGAVVVVWNGLSVLVPSATELVWHAAEHSCTHGTGGVTLRQFLPAAALLANAGAVDLDALQQRTAGERLFEGDDLREVSSASVERWLAIAAALGGSSGMLTAWDHGRDRLWRLLSWRLAVLRRTRVARLRPYLLDAGTRAVMGLGATRAAQTSAVPYRVRHAMLTAIAGVAHRLLGPGR